MRRPFKLLLWAMLGPLAVLLLLALAWVACNGYWADADPQPVPPELKPQAVTLAPADNAFFDGQGLRAPEGESPNAWGQRAWLGESDKDARLLAMPTGEDWTCNATKTDCVARWRADAAMLKAQMATARVFGERCQALAGRHGYQEPVPVLRPRLPGGDAYIVRSLPQFLPASSCMAWLQIEAVIASDATQAALGWQRADALLRLMASGAQTLLGQAVTWSWATRHQLLLAQWAARQPAGFALPAAWLAPMPARILQPRVWIASEAQFQRETIADLKAHREQLFGTDPTPLQSWAGRLSLGYLPERTAQAFNAAWLADTRAFGELQGPALVQRARSVSEPDRPLLSYLRWRNTVGHVLQEVARPQFKSYPLRQADLVLSQAALEMSQQLNDVPAAERAAWWAGRPMEPGIRERLSLEGDALVVRTWRAEAEPAQVPLRFPLRPA